MSCVKLFTLFTYVILLSSDVAHGKFIFQEDIQRSIGQKKEMATWEEAKKRCENAGAILASPVDEKVLKHMMSYINVNNHTNPYFIGIKAKYNPKPEFYTAENVLLDDLPDVVLDMIDTLDPHEGDCLAMNRDSIIVVPCWHRYPYICYTNPKSDEPEEVEAVKPTEAAPVTTEPTTTEAVTETTKAVKRNTVAPECEYDGAILASPVDEKVLKHMMSYIDVNNHTNLYFIGIKAKYNPKPQFYTTEDVLLDDLPDVVLDMIDTLDPHDGDCLAMNRDSIIVVPCWNRYPYICYTKPKIDEPEEVETVKPTKAAPVTTVPTTTEAVTETTEAVTETTEAVPETIEAVKETTVTPECDYDGYKYYPATGRCYRLDRIGKTWSDANVTCDDEGGYLVIVNDTVEAKTLENIIKKNELFVADMWVGLTDVTGKGDWRSIHDDPIEKIYNCRSDSIRRFDAPNWCAILRNDATLFEHPCEYRLPFLCEKSL